MGRQQENCGGSFSHQVLRVALEALPVRPRIGASSRVGGLEGSVRGATTCLVSSEAVLRGPSVPRRFDCLPFLHRPALDWDSNDACMDWSRRLCIKLDVQ